MNSANKIFAEISVGELLDKISILEIKQKNLKDTEKTKIVTKELESLNNTLKKLQDEITDNDNFYDKIKLDKFLQKLNKKLISNNLNENIYDYSISIIDKDNIEVSYFLKQTEESL